MASTEVRTAIFLRRDDQGNYAFAHRSFLEFFLARHLAGRLRSGEPEVLHLRRLSREVITFLCHLAEPQRLLSIAREILAAPYQKRISENTLQIYYWTIRILEERDGRTVQPTAFSRWRPKRMNLAAALLDGLDLGGIDLADADLGGVDRSRSVLDGGLLVRTRLTDANLRECRLAAADLTQARLDRANLSYADLTQADLRGADLTGAVVTAAMLLGADLRRATMDSADFTLARMRGVKLDPAAVDKVKGRWIGYLKPRKEQFIPLPPSPLSF